MSAKSCSTIKKEGLAMAKPSPVSAFPLVFARFAGKKQGSHGKSRAVAQGVSNKLRPLLKMHMVPQSDFGRGLRAVCIACGRLLAKKGA